MKYISQLVNENKIGTEFMITILRTDRKYIGYETKDYILKSEGLN